MKPRILILESIHPDGLSVMHDFADVEEFLGRSRAEQLTKISEYEAVVVKSVTRVDREFIDCARALRVVGRAGSGTDNFEEEYLAAKNITLLTVPTGNTASAAEFALMQILCLVKNAYRAQKFVARNDFRRSLLEGRELGNLTVGIVGFGNLGHAIMKLLKGFGCRILVNDIRPEVAAEIEASGAGFVSQVAELVARCDVVTLHASLNSTSRGMIGRQVLAKAKPGLLLVNTARGALIENGALIASLDSGRVAAVAIDTLFPEPPYDASPDNHRFSHPFLGRDDVFITPHMAASTMDAQRRIGLDLAGRMKEMLLG